MRQRAVLAMALAAKPKLLIADEPTTALDATIQLEILKLLKDLQARLGMAVLLITHNINVARFMSKNLLVMQNGRAVAYGDTNEIINRPSDPYTANLIECYRKLNPAVVSRA
jgi:microcin C transport system ATP-binding protein